MQYSILNVPGPHTGENVVCVNSLETTIYKFPSTGISGIISEISNLTNVKWAQIQSAQGNPKLQFLVFYHSNITLMYLFNGSPTFTSKFVLNGTNFTAKVDATYTTPFESGLGCSNGSVYRCISTPTSVSASNVTVNLLYSHLSSVKSIYYNNTVYMSQDASYTFKGYNTSNNQNLYFNIGNLTALVSTVRFDNNLAYFFLSDRIITAYFNSTNNTYMLNFTQYLNSTK